NDYTRVGCAVAFVSLRSGMNQTTATMAKQVYPSHGPKGRKAKPMPTAYTTTEALPLKSPPMAVATNDGGGFAARIVRTRMPYATAAPTAPAPYAAAGNAWR